MDPRGGQTNRGPKATPRQLASQPPLADRVSKFVRSSCHTYDTPHQTHHVSHLPCSWVAWHESDGVATRAKWRTHSTTRREGTPHPASFLWGKRGREGKTTLVMNIERMRKGVAKELSFSTASRLLVGRC